MRVINPCTALSQRIVHIVYESDSLWSIHPLVRYSEHGIKKLKESRTNIKLKGDLTFTRQPKSS